MWIVPTNPSQFRLGTRFRIPSIGLQDHILDEYAGDGYDPDKVMFFKQASGSRQAFDVSYCIDHFKEKLQIWAPLCPKETL